LHVPARGKDERDSGSTRPSSGTRCRSEHAARAAVGSVWWPRWCGVRDWLSADCGLCGRRELVIIFHPLPAVLCTSPPANLRLFPGERAARGGIVSDRRLMDGTNRTLSTHRYLRRDSGGHDSNVACGRAALHALGCHRTRSMSGRSMWRCVLESTILPSLLPCADQVTE